MSEQTNVVELSEDEKKAQTEFYRAMSMQTIQHLGGVNRLAAMIGANQFVFDRSETQFTFKGCPKANFVKIKLDESKDLYEMKIYKTSMRGGEFKINLVHEQADLYDDMLKSEFEEATGLRLSL